MPTYRGNPLDESVNTELMRVCKCVVPYLDRNVQKNVAIGIKFLELVNTINTFNDATPLSPQLSLTRQGNWQDDLLQDIRSNLSSEKAYLIDAMLKLQQVKSILNVKDSMSESHTTPSNAFVPPSDTPTHIVPPPDVPLFFPDSNYQRPDHESYFDKSQPSPPQGSGPSPAAFLQALSPMLDDNQRQMLTLLSTFMNK